MRAYIDGHCARNRRARLGQAHSVLANTCLSKVRSRDEIAVYDGAVDASTFADRVSETGISSASSFIYDANDNRTVLDAGTTTNLSYQPLSNRLSAIDGIPLHHDMAGNRTADLGGYAHVQLQRCRSPVWGVFERQPGNGN